MKQREEGRYDFPTGRQIEAKPVAIVDVRMPADWLGGERLSQANRQRGKAFTILRSNRLPT